MKSLLEFLNGAHTSFQAIAQVRQVLKENNYEELTICDDFMFSKVMADEKLLKELLEGPL